MRNFAFPYFSRDIAEFWRRWHISLSSWFRDYLYIPLGGSRGKSWMKIRNTFIIFVVSGFWHGANWTFIVWGALNALYFIPLMLMKRNRKNLDMVAEGRLFPSFSELGGMVLTFLLTLLAWIFFRAENLPHAFSYLGDIFTRELFMLPLHPEGFNQFKYALALIYILILVVVEWVNRKHEHALTMERSGTVVRWSVYTLLILTIVVFRGASQEFIYFQF
jgi:D-alanyl-lipoteichoic acid acyltransferase DltB (MBOAT superfamily)